MNYLICLILAIALSGCAVTVVPNPAPDPAKAETPPPSPQASPSVSPTPAPTSSASPVPSPRPTPLPSPTPAPLSQSTPSPSTKPTIAPSATPVPAGKVVVNIPATANLVTVLNASKPNTLYVLAKANYLVNGSIVLSAANVSINLNGSALSMTPSAGSSTQFGIRAANIEIYNGRITKAFTFARSYADHFYLHDVVFDNIVYTSGQQSGGINQIYLSDNAMAKNNTLDHLTVGYTGTVSIYNSADNFTLKNSSLAGSYGEYCFRSEVTSVVAGGPPTTRPNNTLLDNVKCDNTINAYGKSCIGIRMGGTGLVIQNSSINGSATSGYVNLGQGKSGTCTTPGCFVGGITLRNNQFLGHRVPQLAIDSGVIAVVENNTFTTWVDMVNVAMASYTSTTLKNNIRLMTPVGAKPLKPFAGSNTNPKGVWTEAGTIVK